MNSESTLLNNPMEELRQQVDHMIDGGIEELLQVGGPVITGPMSNHTNSINRRNKTRTPIHTIMNQNMSLEDAVRIELKALPSKTPVSILQELLSRRGTTPKYELVQIEGAIHEPTFRYRVTVSQIVDPTISAMGTGRSKKEAKHAAAKSIIDKLIVNGSDDVSVSNNLSETKTQEMEGDFEDKASGNPIGSLQELCMSRHWPPPQYLTEGEEGLPHERQFTIVCTILKHRQIGQGKSKKLAKRQAALKMWQFLLDLPPNVNSPTGMDEEEIVQKNINVSTRYAELKNCKIKTLSNVNSLQVSQFHKNLKASAGVKLSDLQDTPLSENNVDVVKFLQEIADEQRFEVTYVAIEEKSTTGKCQFLIQLSTLPVAVCYGTGVTVEDAQVAAAHNALEYLKIMTKN